MGLFNRGDKPDMRGGVIWSRNPADFATRIDHNDVSGLGSSDIAIEMGTNALLLTDGALRGVAAPGRYTLTTLGERLNAVVALKAARQVSAVVIDTNEVDLVCRIENARAKDGLTLGVELTLAVRLPAWDPQGRPRVVDFFTNLMKDRKRYSLEDLRDYLIPEIADAAGEYLRNYELKDIDSGLAKKEALGEAILAHLERTLQATGLEFRRVRAIRVFHTRYDAIRKQNEDLELQVSEAQAKLEGRRRLYDVAKAQDLQALAQESDQVGIFEKRAAVNERMRKALSEDKMSEIRSEEDFKIFLARVDYDNILREEERAKLLEEFRNARADRIRAREHILAVADIEGRYELEMLRLKRTQGLSAAEFEFQAAQARDKAKFETDLALQRVNAELAIRKAKEDFERESASIAAADARTRQLQAEKDTIEKALTTARTKSEIADLERQEDEKDAELGMRMLERMKAIRRHDDFEREIRRRQTAREELEDRLVERKAVFEQEQARIAQEYRFKIDYAAKLGEIGGKDALIALAEGGSGQLLKELAETREYRGMSPEQLEMLMSAKSGAMAQALLEKYKAQANQGQGLSQEQTKLYERLVQVTQETARREADAMRDAMRDQRSMAENLGGMIRDVGLGRPGQTQPPPIIVTGGGMAFPSTPAASTPGAPSPAKSPAEVWVCPKCQHKSKPGVKFCANCGHKYYD
jgi:hypothetical protein